MAKGIKNGISIYFQKDNINALTIKWDDDKGKKQLFYTAIPPVKYCVDLIDFDDKLIPGVYNHNFNGIVIVTTPVGRSVYFEGTLMAYKEY